MEDDSPDRVERIRDFLVRHGGPSAKQSREGKSQQGSRGWSEIYAMDGYALRCEWSQVGSRHEMSYSEIAPAAPASAWLPIGASTPSSPRSSRRSPQFSARSESAA